MDVAGKGALVTGGAVRVGRAISLALAREGARVVIHYHSSSAAADALVREIAAFGGTAISIQADLRSASEVNRLATTADDEHGPIDLLVNNASIFPAEGIGEVDLALWEETIAVNLRAPFFLTQTLGGRMKGRGGGVIINLADLAGLRVWTGYAAHGISKAGIVQLTRIAARALAPEVRVAAIAPGTVLPPADLDDEDVRALADRAPLRRIGSPDDVVDALLYLVRADFVTGEVVVVDGGKRLT
jgi:NAD(P)-dependent dehydrogenase (short-subunit alcohol dehydrogenase family)